MRFNWRAALGIVLSAALLVWTLWGIDPADVWSHLRGSNLPLLLLATVVATLIFPMRAWRWRYILAPIDATLPFGMLWRATAIGMMVNNVAPLRAGEVARAYALSRESSGRVPFSSAFASLAADRVFDAVVVLLLMIAAMLDPAFGAHDASQRARVVEWVKVGVVVAAAALVGLYVIVFFPERMVRLYEGLTRRLSPRLRERGRAILLAFAAGLGVLRSPVRFALVLVWTTAHWLVNGLAFWLGFVAVGMDVPFSAGLMLQGIIAIGVAIPSAPGFFGVFEAFAKLGLSAYGVDETLAVSWAIGFHLLSFLPITVIGLVYFVRLGMHFRELRPPPEPSAADAAVPSRPSPERA